MWWRSRNLDAEESSLSVTGIESLGAVNEHMFVENVFLEPAWFSAVAQYFFSNQERDYVFVGGAFEGHNDVDIIGFGEVSDLSAEVFGRSSFEVRVA